MKDYIKQLELENEELRQKLADAESHTPKWVFEENIDYLEDCIGGWVYVLGDKIFGYIVIYEGTVVPCIHGKTKFSKIESDSIDDVKKQIEQEYYNIFIGHTNE